jgi:SNF2 family DNA or RNA helicase
MATISKVDDKIQLFTEYSDIEKCRSIPCGKWNKKVSCWEYPLEALPNVIGAFPRATVDSILKGQLRRFDVIERNVSALVRGETEPRDHPFLMAHQRKCRDIAIFKNKYAWYMDTGTGKTLTAYAVIEDKITAKWLVICPRSIIKTAWVEDHLHFFPYLKVLPMSTNMKKKDYLEVAERWGLGYLGKLKTADIPKYLMQYADVIVINPESFKIRDDVRTWPHAGLIVDESSILRDMRSQITKSVIEHADRMQYTYLLSGKPAPNSDLEYFAQMRVVNRALLGDSFFKFRDTFFKPIDYFGRDFRMIPEMKEAFSQRLAKSCIYISKGECLDLPKDMPPIIRSVELPKDAMRQYRQMEKDSILLLQDKSVAASNKLAAMMKLRQMTSGFIIDTNDDSKVMQLHHAKLDELRSVITELGDNKAVIWINFKHEVADIMELVASMGKTAVTAYSGTKNTDDSIDDFKSDKAQFIIAHPKTLKYGVTFTGESMVKNCTYAIYYSMSHSFEDYYQSHDRIYRKGQTEACTFILLIAEHTIDEDISAVVTRKGSNAEVMENMIRRCGDAEISED